MDDVKLVRPRPGTVVVECRDEHDLATRAELRELLENLVSEHELVVVDLSEATFIDSSVIQNLLIADELGRKGDSHVRLQLGKAPMVQRALQMSGVLEILDHAETRDQALAAPPSG